MSFLEIYLTQKLLRDVWMDMVILLGRTLHLCSYFGLHSHSIQCWSDSSEDAPRW